ncbi:hypothetical protein ACLVWU_05170 [Bdellovibrio sp. HCB290]|uniref:hypothetical protein n=1 Tax=Bdellovibrio sp. HCB290 TaxID=3394356 RepID=UPI0039B5DCA8
MRNRVRSLLLTMVLASFFSFPGQALTATPAKVDGPIVKVFKEKYLPKNLAKIELGITDKAQVLALLGKPLKTEPSLFFYDLAGHRFDTTIELKNDKVHSVYFSIPIGTVQLKDIESLFTKEQLQSFKTSSVPPIGHAAGREGQIRIEKEKLLLTIKKTKNSSIKSYFQSL